MIVKAVGTVNFHHFKLIKNYNSEYQRKLKLLDRLFCDKLKIE